MARDLNFPLKIVMAPTVREPDGLAMSSRNKYLQSGDCAASTVLSRSLAGGATVARDGSPSGRGSKKN